MSNLAEGRSREVLLRLEVRQDALSGGAATVLAEPSHPRIKVGAKGLHGVGSAALPLVAGQVLSEAVGPVHSYLDPFQLVQDKSILPNCFRCSEGLGRRRLRRS